MVMKNQVCLSGFNIRFAVFDMTEQKIGTSAGQAFD